MKEVKKDKNGVIAQTEIYKLLTINTEIVNESLGFEICDVKNCDSKNREDVENRKNLTKVFLTDNKKMFRITRSSSERCDFSALKLLIDAKNYVYIQGKMKFPKNLNSIDFIKGSDSNIKYALFYCLSIPELYDYYFNKKTSIFDYLKVKYHDETYIKTISKKDFMHIFNFMELGFAYKQNEKDKKLFISDSGDSFEFKMLDSSLIGNSIQVKMQIDDKGYVYIFFYDDINCVYIMSQRCPKEKNKANCSFINRNYMITKYLIKDEIYKKSKNLNKNNNNEYA